MQSVKSGNCIIEDISFTNHEVIITFNNDDMIKISLDAYLSGDTLIKGQEVSLQRLEAIKRLNGKYLLLQKAYQLLQKKMLSSFLLKEKLLKIQDQELVNEVISELEKKDYLNDYEYAFNTVSTYSAKNKGWKFIEVELKKDGISEKVLDTVKSKYSFKIEEKRAKTIADKLIKLWKDKSFKQALATIYRTLITKGYSEDMAEGIVNSLNYAYSSEKELIFAKKDYKKIKVKYRNIANKKSQSNKIYTSLLTKGYGSSIIKEAMKEDEDVYDD